MIDPRRPTDAERLADPAEAELAALGTATAALGDRLARPPKLPRAARMMVEAGRGTLQRNERGD